MNSAPAALADLNADELREMVTDLLQNLASNTGRSYGVDVFVLARRWAGDLVGV
jgi:hypothetical protein